MGQMRNFGNGLSRQRWERGWRQKTLCACPQKYGFSRFCEGISGKVTFFMPSLLPFMQPSCHWDSSDVHPLLADFLMIVWRKHPQQFTNKQINHAETKLSIKKKTLQNKVSALLIISQNIYWGYALKNLIYGMSSDYVYKTQVNWEVSSFTSAC